MIRFESVSKEFGPKKVLDRISFEVPEGEILFILGKSGMGKSVTLKHIIGLLKPDGGKVFVDDQNVPDLGEDALAKVRRKCGMVFQHPALLDSLSVYDNVAFGLKTPQYIENLGRTLSPSEERNLVLEKIRLVHLDDSVLDKHPPEISYGMQKRVSLARTLAPGPEYLLFDEPTTGLDPISTNTITDLIRDLSKHLKVTSIVVSHDMGSALRIADRILVLDQGKILALETVEDIKKSKEPLIQEFLEETLSVGSEEANRSDSPRLSPDREGHA